MIKLFEQYKEYDQVRVWLNEMGIYNYIINDDLTVDVKGSVNIYNKSLTNIPIKFNKVSGDFQCYKNKLTSLDGMPSIINGWFDCSYNRLTTLEGCPKYISGHFLCTNNRLTSLKGGPTNLNMKIAISKNPLPQEVLDFFDTNLLFDYQEEYGIWNSDGSFNKKRFGIFLHEFNEHII